MVSSRSTALQSLLGYVAVFAVLTHAWWSTATYAVAPGNDPRDARLIIWILGWVAQALVHAPARLFDAPIFFPAPAQLAGSEHLLSAQLLFAPIYWTTGNAVLAANLVALLSYPASAFAMERLLAAQGLGRGAAWFGGLTFALGALRVPASLQVVQYLPLFLPLVALRLQRLRERPSARQFVLLSASLLLGMFGSYYLATLLVLTSVVWGTFELVRCESSRTRVVVLSGASLLGASSILALVSRPYLHRLTTPPPSPDAFWRAVGWTLFVADLHDPVWLALSALAVGGVIASRRAGRSRRALAATSVAFVVLGVVLLAFGWPGFLGRWLGFFRDRTRYLLLASFGASLLVAQGYDALRTKLPRRFGGAVLLATAAGALVWARMASLAPQFDAVLAASRDLEYYRGVGRLVRAEGAGPLLELPYVSTPMVDHGAEEMVGQLQHGMPLITGFTGYRPAHLPLVASLIGALPAAAAIDDLVDLTHLRWILVRPPDEWSDARARQRLLAGLGRMRGLGPSWTIGPWVLQRLDRAPEHPAWFTALAAGAQPDRSVMGTPLSPIPEEQALASISARVAPGPVVARWFVAVDATASNRGAAAWPTWAAGGWSAPGLVHWETRWRRADGGQADWEPAKAFPLRRDVPPNEALSQTLVLPTPAEPGSYDLRIAVAQTDGAGFSSAGNEVAILRLEVAPPRF